MPTHPPQAADPQPPEQVREAGLARLRQAGNPFTFSVATAGTEENCLHYDVPDLLDSQRSDLRAIVELYRDPKQPSRLFPVLGSSGSGKTHLLKTFKAELQREAEESGKETLLITADHFAIGLDAIDFFLWQIVDHLLDQAGAGARMLRILSTRLATRLLAESLRRLPPQEQVRLIPPSGLLEKLALRVGNAAASQRRLSAVRGLIERCESAGAADLPKACQEAGIDPARAQGVVEAHLERTEPKDVAGTLRRNLYARLTRLALLGDRQTAEDFLAGEEYREGPAYLAGAGQLTRRLLVVFLELFRALRIPVVLVFDQVEDFLIASTSEVKQEMRDAFSQALSALVNNVSGLCMLVFAERGLWNEAILGRVDTYARDRMDQEFSLPGRPSRRAIDMPDRVSRQHLVELIKVRVRSALSGFDTTGLPETFPYTEDNLKRLEQETTVRGCIRKLSAWFNEVVFPPQRPAGDEETGKKTEGDGTTGTGEGKKLPELDDGEGLITRFRALWQAELQGAKKRLEGGEPRPTLIPEIQTALHTWLEYLKEEGITGSGPWAKVELVTDKDKGQYGFLNVIRFGSPDAPGLGIAAWLANTRGRPIDLRRRLEFFDKNPCPIRKLVLFREDGDHALGGDTKPIYDAAVKKGRDVLVFKYEQSQLESLLAFSGWLQAVKPEAKAAGQTGAAALKGFVTRLSAELLGWIDSWRPPQSGGKA